jgi:UDP-3-O-[3-hydroxymyristoyl] glucosamine N-acyltransferase
MTKQTYRTNVATIADMLGAQVIGDKATVITGVATLQTAQHEQISFLDNAKYRKHLPATKAAAVILAEKFVSECPTVAIVCADPYLAYAKVAKLFEYIPTQPTGIHSSAVIGKDCQIDPTASIAANCVLADHVIVGKNVILGPGCAIGEFCTIGDNTRFHARVTLYHGVTIGKNVIIHSGAVLGADGFGLAQSQQGWHKVPQLGGVTIGNNVEIGANTCIDRGALEDTVIEDGAMLDNQIQIGHNVRIGSNTAVAGCVGIAGSAQIGKNCLIGGGAGILGHIKIADGTMIAAMAGIAKSITEPGIYIGGIPADKHEKWRKNAVQFKHLNEIAARLARLEAHFQLNKENSQSFEEDLI